MRAFGSGGERGFRPEAGSPSIRFAAGFGGDLVYSREVVLLEVGMLIENLLLGHSGAQPSEDIPHCDAQTSNARLATALAGFNRNPSGRYWHIPTGISMTHCSLASGRVSSTERVRLQEKIGALGLEANLAG